MGSIFHANLLPHLLDMSVDPLHDQSLKRTTTGQSMSDDAEVFSKPIDGQLSKYTNVMKGWQYRWFVLYPSKGIIEYYEKEEQKRTQKPRGALSLAGSIISPSDEDSNTFSVNATNGEIYRLRADNAKERHFWVSHLRYAVQHARRDLDSVSIRSRTETLDEKRPPISSVASVWYDSPKPPKQKPRSVSAEENSALTEVKDYVNEMYILEEKLADKIDSLPMQGAYINALDQDMLLLKACSRATLGCLEHCLNTLVRQHAAAARLADKKNHLSSGAKLEWHGTTPRYAIRQDSMGDSPLDVHTKIIKEQSEFGFSQSFEVPTICHDDEELDAECFEEKDLGEIEQHKSVILHLLSQLKLGMDLTKVVLPTFILEKRSLLEMFADCMAHPDIFLRVADHTSPADRMMQVVEWYLTSFHEGRKGSIAKKPYNPIIGETFHCSWTVEDEVENQSHRLVYTAEQVSHHPPVSAFYASCPKKGIHMNGSLWTKSKFMGMSIGVTLVGNLTLSLSQYNEDYVMTLPSAYARSILTYPWVELGDKCTVQCKQTGYSANVVFHTKPFYGGKLHRVSAEVKNNENSIITRINGTWNGTMEVVGSAGTRIIDTSRLPVYKKKVRPIGKQGEFESRRLWQHVTNALRHNDIQTATEHKTLLENNQRVAERHRKEKGINFPTRYFHRVGVEVSEWIHKDVRNKT